MNDKNGLPIPEMTKKLHWDGRLCGIADNGETLVMSATGDRFDWDFCPAECRPTQAVAIGLIGTITELEVLSEDCLKISTSQGDFVLMDKGGASPSGTPNLQLFAIDDAREVVRLTNPKPDIELDAPPE